MPDYSRHSRGTGLGQGPAPATFFVHAKKRAGLKLPARIVYLSWLSFYSLSSSAPRTLPSVTSISHV